jgi:glycosyltransferase involved in cell wall biosynthesis
MRADVSIVLPTHNGARHLHESIESCLAQTYPHFELIVVDDGSTDATSAIAETHARHDSRVRVIRLDPNRRLPGALNAGFAEAAGRYLTWTSDDNLFRPSALEALVEVLEQQPEIDVVYSDYSVVDAEGHDLGPGPVAERAQLLRLNAVGPCFLYRRAVHDIVGAYAEDLFLAEDYDYWLRVSAAHELHWLRRDLYVYRRHDRSLTATQARGVAQAVERSLARNLPRLRWATALQRARVYARLARDTPNRRRRPLYLLRACREACRPPFRE